jgi:hypothetical protein
VVVCAAVLVADAGSTERGLAACLGAVVGGASGRGVARWRSRLALFGAGELRAVVAAAALEWPENPRAETATNAMNNAVDAAPIPRLVRRRRLSAESRR